MNELVNFVTEEKNSLNFHVVSDISWANGFRNGTCSSPSLLSLLTHVTFTQILNPDSCSSRQDCNDDGFKFAVPDETLTRSIASLYAKPTHSNSGCGKWHDPCTFLHLRNSLLTIQCS